MSHCIDAVWVFTLVMAASLIAYLVGVAVGVSSTRKEAKKRGMAGYNEYTGDFEWWGR
jgi:hypothetical protein